MLCLLTLLFNPFNMDQFIQMVNGLLLSDNKLGVLLFILKSEFCIFAF